MKLNSILWVLVAITFVGADLHAGRRTEDSFGAIAYRLIPAFKKKRPSYRLGLAGGYQDVEEAIFLAERQCGWGCEGFTFMNGCAGVGITKPRFGKAKNYGMVAADEGYSWSVNKNRARSKVRDQLKRLARRKRVELLRTAIACTY